MSESKEQKINGILKNSLKVLAEKGYDNATIADISKASNVSRGLLHYYFSDKEDLVSKVLAASSDNIIQTALDGLQGRTPEEVVDNMIKSSSDSLEKHPDFYAFLFEMWCASRRNDKIKKELIECSEKVSDAIRKSLDVAIRNGALEINPDNSKEISKAILALHDGIAFELMINPSVNLKDKKFWKPIRKMMLAVLKI
jgi:AcrR family transcriptional regulator